MTTIWEKAANFFSETEQNVINVLIQVKNGVAVAIHDLNAAGDWIAAHAPDITAAIQTVLGYAQAIPGATSNPSFTTAVKDANDAVTLLNAFATTHNAGASTAASIVSGYVALKNAQAAAAAAQAAAVAAPAAA